MSGGVGPGIGAAANWGPIRYSGELGGTIGVFINFGGGCFGDKGFRLEGGAGISAGIAKRAIGLSISGQTSTTTNPNNENGWVDLSEKVPFFTKNASEASF